METPLYPQKTPSEALLDEVFDLLALEPGLSLKAVVADAQFSGGLTLRSLLRAGVPFVGRMRSRVKVRPLDSETGEVGEETRVGELLLAYPPGKARYYRRFGVYAKQVRVMWPQVGLVDLVLILFHADSLILGHQWKRVCRLRVSGSPARTRHRSATTSIISSRSRKYRLATASFTKGHTRSTGCSSGL